MFRHLTGFFTQTWPHLKRSTGDVIKRKFTWNESICKYWNLCLLSRVCLFWNPPRHPDVDILCSPLIQISSLRRNNNVFTSAVGKGFDFTSGCTINIILSNLRTSDWYMIIWISSQARASTQIPPDTKVFLYYSTPHCGRTTLPSYIKWWSCIFRERVWPHG